MVVLSFNVPQWSCYVRTVNNMTAQSYGRSSSARNGIGRYLVIIQRLSLSRSPLATYLEVNTPSDLKPSARKRQQSLISNLLRGQVTRFVFGYNKHGLKISFLPILRVSALCNRSIRFNLQRGQSCWNILFIRNYSGCSNRTYTVRQITIRPKFRTRKNLKTVTIFGMSVRIQHR